MAFIPPIQIRQFLCPSFTAFPTVNNIYFIVLCRSGVCGVRICAWNRPAAVWVDTFVSAKEARVWSRTVCNVGQPALPIDCCWAKYFVWKVHFVCVCPLLLYLRFGALHTSIVVMCDIRFHIRNTCWMHKQTRIFREVFVLNIFFFSSSRCCTQHKKLCLSAAGT